MMELDACKVEVVVQDHEDASLITVGGGIGGLPQVMWEHPVKPGHVTSQGQFLSTVSQRRCGAAWLLVRYRIGGAVLPCSGSADGTLAYVAKPGEVTQLRCNAPEPPP